jgi:hypothetical protein
MAVPPGDGRLRMFSLVWTAHRLVTEWLVRLFSPADPGEPFNSDRMNTIGFKRPVSLTSWAHRQFKAVVFEKARDMLVESVHDAMNRDREGGVTDRTVAKNAIDMFLLMGVCDTDAVQNLRNDLDMRRRVLHSAMAVNESFVVTFQEPIVDRSISYYGAIASSATEVLDVPAYLHLVRSAWVWPVVLCRVVCTVWYVPCGMCRVVCTVWYVPCGMYRVVCAVWCMVWRMACGVACCRSRNILTTKTPGAGCWCRKLRERRC